jgi:septal ring factor EnvC (AmiA/AmiB activator)
MKKILIIFILCVNFLHADTNQLILEEIKQLRIDMNKRFEQVDKRFEQVDRQFDQIDKRFEQVDKRFEQVDKRLDFSQNLIIAMLAIVLATPFYLKRRDAKDQEKLEKINSVLMVLREMASDNPKIEHSMKIAGL